MYLQQGASTATVWTQTLLKEYADHSDVSQSDGYRATHCQLKIEVAPEGVRGASGVGASPEIGGWTGNGV